MAANTDAARLFAADEDVLLQHQLAYMLEADAVLVKLAPVAGCDTVNHFGGVEGPRHIARPLLALEQPLEQDAVDFIGVDEAALLIHRANAVRVAVGGKAGLAAVLQD